MVRRCDPLSFCGHTYCSSLFGLHGLTWGRTLNAAREGGTQTGSELYTTIEPLMIFDSASTAVARTADTCSDIQHIYSIDNGVEC